METIFINRRRLMQGTAAATVTAALPSSAKTLFPLGTPAIAANTGHAMVELFNLGTGTDFPFINQMHSAGPIWEAAPAPSTDPYLLFDSAGYPTAFPTGSYQYKTTFAVYFVDGDSWVLTFNGDPAGGAGQVSFGASANGIIFTAIGGTVGRWEYSMAYDTSTAAWNSGTAYAGGAFTRGDAVKAGGKYWSCITSNTNVDPTTDNGQYWVEITTGTMFSGTIYLQVLSSPYVTNIQIYRKSYETTGAGGYVGSCTLGTCSGTTLDLTGGTFRGQVNIGDEVYAQGVPDASTIVRQLTGTTGQTGTYQISSPATFSTPVIVTTHQIFDPYFISFFSGWGTIRFMHWMGVIVGPQCRWENRPVRSKWSWIGSQLNNNAYAGWSTQAGDNAFVGTQHVNGSPSSWTHGQLVQLTLKNQITYFALNGYTNSVDNQTTVFQANGHTFQAGDFVFFDSCASTAASVPAYNSSTTYNLGAVATFGGLTFEAIRASSNSNQHSPDPTIDNSTTPYWMAIQANSFDKARIFILGFYQVVSASGNYFTLNIDTTHWETYSSGGLVAKQITVSDVSGGLPPMRVVGPAGNPYAYYFDPYAPVLLDFIYDANFDALIASGGPDTWGGTNLGVPLEILIAMANKLNVNPWFNVPYMATIPSEVGGGNDYCTQMATLIKNNLNPTLKSYVELGNEVWNGSTGYNATPYGNSVANIKWGNSVRSYIGGNQYYYDFTWYGWRFYYVMEAFSAVYSGAMNRLVRVLAEFTAMPGAASGGYTGGDRHRALDYNSVSLAPDYPIKSADALAIAPYITPPTAPRQTITASISNGSGGAGNNLYVTGLGGGYPFAIGQYVYAAGVAPNTQIVSGPGNGVTGTFTVSGAAQNIASTTMSVSSITTQMIYDNVYSGNSTLANAAIAALDYQLRNIQYGGFSEWDNQNTTYPEWASVISTENANTATYGTTLNLKLICYEGSLGFLPNTDWPVVLGANPVSGKTLTVDDLLHFYINYYESSTAATLLKDDITSFLANGGSNWAQYPLIGGWGQQMFGLMQGNEYSPTYPSYTELKKFNSTGTP